MTSQQENNREYVRVVMGEVAFRYDKVTRQQQGAR